MQFRTSHLISSALCVVVVVIFLRTLRLGTVEKQELDHDPPSLIPVGDEHFLRLSRALQIRTISWSITDYNISALQHFHQFLRQEFPNVFGCSFITTELVSNYSLLFKVSGSDASLQPYLLMSHMDVVPAVSPEWTVDPFSGRMDDTYIWGRGAIDVKNTLVAIMEVLEVIAKSNHRPKRSFYVAFGHDEEVGGTQGARVTARLLEQRNVRFDFILDEGMVLVEDTVVPGSTVALVAVAEKGLLTVRLSINMTGGHSSAPRSESSLSAMATAVARLSHTPHPHHFGHGVEVEMLEQLAPYVPIARRIFVSNLWLFGPLVAWFMCRKSETAAGIRTTTSVTIFNSGVKANVIPGYAEAIVNHRVNPRDSFEEVLQRDRDIIDDDRIKIDLIENVLPNHPPSPVSSSKTFGFSVIRKSVTSVFKDVPAVPALCIGNTDTRHYLALSDNVYRFTPTIFKPGDTKRFHGPNERITKDNYVQTIHFFQNIIHHADGSDPHEARTHPPHDL